MTIRKLTLMLAALTMILGAAAVASAEDYEFVGVDGCKMCHKKDASGDQYGKWSASPHAKAFETLATDAAKAIATEKGLGDPQQAGECLKCHVTAYGVDEARLGSKYTMEEGVGCESCHGAGGEYKSMKTMKALTSGEIEAASVGLTEITAETCTACHNEESPTFKGFDYEAALEKVAHPIPEEHMANYK